MATDEENRHAADRLCAQIDRFAMLRIPALATLVETSPLLEQTRVAAKLVMQLQLQPDALALLPADRVDVVQQLFRGTDLTLAIPSHATSPAADAAGADEFRGAVGRYMDALSTATPFSDLLKQTRQLMAQQAAQPALLLSIPPAHAGLLRELMDLARRGEAARQRQASRPASQLTPPARSERPWAPPGGSVPRPGRR